MHAQQSLSSHTGGRRSEAGSYESKSNKDIMYSPRDIPWVVIYLAHVFTCLHVFVSCCCTSAPSMLLAGICSSDLDQRLRST